MEGTNESIVNSYAYMKNLRYGVEGNANWQPYLKMAIKGNFQYKVDTSSNGHLIVKCKDARCPWIAKDEVSYLCDLALLKDCCNEFIVCS
ncbi:unnamed protein product [Malus baccata var. baccata]